MRGGERLPREYGPYLKNLARTRAGEVKTNRTEDVCKEGAAVVNGQSAALARYGDSEVRVDWLKLSTPEADWCLGNRCKESAEHLASGLMLDPKVLKTPGLRYDSCRR
jgi:hypothetical protein